VDRTILKMETVIVVETFVPTYKKKNGIIIQHAVQKKAKHVNLDMIRIEESNTPLLTLTSNYMFRSHDHHQVYTYDIGPNSV
jgi:hypothetical protein